jgi:hypothetical protein
MSSVRFRSSAKIYERFSWCHPLGTANSHTMGMPNPAKLRALCSNECGRRIVPGNRLFCSNRCHFEFQRRSIIASFKAGTYTPISTFNKVLRQYLIDIVGECCQRCGWSERNAKTGRVPLEIEHIDGNWRNNREENLTVICPNCHALTSTFRALNRGNGRPGRPGLRPIAVKPDAIEE